MDWVMLECCLEIIVSIFSIYIVDIMGGVLEMNLYFCWFVEEVYVLGKKVIDCCNLIIL